MLSMKNIAELSGETWTPPLNELHFDAGDHVYSYNGVKIPSVTTILGQTPDAFDMKYSSHIPRFVLNRAAAKGTAIHEYIENHFGGNVEISPRTLELQRRNYGYIAAFYAWENEHDIEPIHQEVRTHDGLNYAGTVDFVAHVDGKLTIVDWKTQRNASPLKWVLQLTAYKKTVEELLSRDVEMLAILHLLEDGSYGYYTFDANPVLWETLLHYVSHTLDKTELSADDVYDLVSLFEPFMTGTPDYDALIDFGAKYAIADAHDVVNDALTDLLNRDVFNVEYTLEQHCATPELMEHVNRKLG
ncbi:MAG: PD-(D/E)XK nuclease family protein [Bacilli bacterium]